MKSSTLINLIERLDNARILNIGDVMLDRFVYGQISRISPEAPIPVLKADQTNLTLGGAGNVVNNLLALGSSVFFVSIVGDDSEAQKIRDILSGNEKIKYNLIVEKQRKTTVKTRFIAQHQQVLRVDRETTHQLEKKSRELALKAIRKFSDSCDIVILSDYRKGLLNREMLSDIIETIKQADKPILVYPKGTDFTCYSGASILTPNLKELSEATRMTTDSDEAIINAAKKLIETCNLNAILITRSQDGMSLIQSSGEVTQLRSEAKEVFDVSGAGDTVIAVLAAAYGVGASLPEAAELANLAAGIVVGKVGTAVTHSKDLIKSLRHQEMSSAESNVLTLDLAIEKVELWRHKGYKIGFTNGIFDLLHPGHLSLLSQAANTCDRLIVGLNGDMSAERLKGEEPLQHEAARSAILASLEFVDIVVIFQEDTPIPILEKIRPNVLIKGANYSPEMVVGADLVRSYGGEIILAHIEDIYKSNPKIDQITKGTL